MDAAVTQLARSGAIPFLCGSAAGCFALYSAKVVTAAGQWRAVSVKAATDMDSALCMSHSVALDQHAASCCALTVTSVASTAEAIVDYRNYRHCSQEKLATYFATRRPFFARRSVLGTAVVSLALSASLVGGFRLMAPQQPLLRHPLWASHAGASPHWEKLWGQDGGLPKGSRFDVAGESLPLTAELKRRNHAPRDGMTALVPGCGRAYDALALARHGFDKVVAVDLSPAACEAAREEISGSSWSGGVQVRCGDFFALDPARDGTYDLIWDNTFLCALEPEVREQWALQMKALLAPGGQLITCVFPIGEREGGPPFAMSVPLVRALLGPIGFEATLVQDQLPLEEQHRRPGDKLESVLTRGTALVTWRLKSQD